MTLKYVGNRQWKGRLAEFSYEDHEEKRFEKIVEYLRYECGLEIDTGCANWAAIQVADYDEFRMVSEYWKEAKRLFKK